MFHCTLSTRFLPSLIQYSLVLKSCNPSYYKDCACITTRRRCIILCIELFSVRCVALWTEVVLVVLQGWCVQSSDPRTLGMNSVPKEVIPGQVNFPNFTSCLPSKPPRPPTKKSSSCISQSSLCTSQARSGCSDVPRLWSIVKARHNLHFKHRCPTLLPNLT